MGSGCCKSSDKPLLDEFPVSETESGYPPPKPPANRKEECFNPQDYKQIDAKAIKPLASAKSTYESLTGEITKDLTTDLQKLRALYVWLGAQKIESESYPKITDNATPRGYMKNIKHKKGTYTGFFTLLCRGAKLQCVIVRGKGKSVGYEVGDKDFKDLNSQWCAVMADGSWRLVHPLWSFQGVKGFSSGNWTMIEKEGKATNDKQTKSSGENVRGMDEFYFLTNPDELIYMCRPDNDPWQLQQSPWSMDKYQSVPLVRSAFFTSGLQLGKDPQGTLKAQKGKCWINFKHEENVDPSVKYQLFHNEKESKTALPKNKKLDRFVAYSNESEEKEFVVRCPAEGVYKMVFPGLCEYRLDCDKVGENVDEFPVNPVNGYGLSAAAKKNGIVSASTTSGFLHVARSQSQTLTFQMADGKQAKATMTGGNNQDFSKFVTQDVNGNKNDVVVNMPPESGQVNDFILSVSVANKVVSNYLVSTDTITNSEKQKAPSGQKTPIRNQSSTKEKSPTKDKSPSKDANKAPAPPPKEEVEPERTALTKATRGNDVAELEAAIQRFEQRGLEDRGDLSKAKERLKKLQEEPERTALTKAARGNDVAELEAAIQRFEQRGLEDRGDLSKAKEKLKQLEKEQEGSNTEQADEQRIRDRLRQAIKDNDIDELEDAMEEFTANRLEDQGDYTDAKQRLLDLYTDALDAATDERQVDKLEYTVERAKNSKVCGSLKHSQSMMDAEETLRQLKRMKKYLTRILAMKQSTVSEISSYKRPKPCIHDIMKATYLILGEKERDLNRWEHIQILTRKLGKQSLIRRIKEFDVIRLRLPVAGKSDRLLDGYDHRVVCNNSAGAGTFYKWSRHMINEVDGPDDKRRTV